MVRSFGSKNTERIWNGERVPKLPLDVQQVGRRKLRMLHNSRDLRDLMVPPGNRLESLRGDLAGYHSIRINDQWRVIFRWDNGDAFEVEIVDYH